MKMDVIATLKLNHNQLPLTELGRLVEADDLNELNKELKPLVDNQTLCLTAQGNVYLLTEEGFHCGLLKMHQKGFGFVSDVRNPERDSYFVPPTAMNGAIKGDEVVYKVSFEDDGRDRAEIIEIAHRDKEFLIGEIRRSYDGRFLDFIPTDISFNNFRMVILNKNDLVLKEHDLYKAKIINIQDRKMFIRLKKNIGNATKAADRILSIAEEFDLPIEFMPNTLRNAQNVNIHPREEKAEFERRLTTSIMDKGLVTIDGLDSKDLDDAIYVERYKDGYKLIVAIADVSHYVLPKSPLDREALRRGNSTYLANMVIPMLPKILSDDLCSLNPNTEKFAMACEMIFDSMGDMVNKRVFETIMISHARLNYDECNKYFQEQKWDKAPEVAKMLDVAHELYLKLLKQREAKGMLNLEIREPKIVMDKDSNVVAIKARQSGPSEQLIEQFMVSANEAVAELVHEQELPFIYRDHGKPSVESLSEWYASLKTFGINIKLTNKEMTDPRNLNKALQMIDHQIANPIEKELLNLSLLRHLDKAEYALENIGHFGLASKCYTHFTSPIRRYPDLMVHRFLREYILNGDTSEALQRQNTDFIKKASLIVNETEINSVDCEREVVKVCMVEFMQDKVGQIYDGVIAVALKFGFFVQLENMVEGLVHISTLGSGVTYDDKTQTLTKDNNTFYRMGQAVKIRVEAVDPQKRTIDFVLV
ncbi:ribonuclease R [Entomoplasma freundtii]|uniref:Ribonuclease R n=1 Tax=Entomoplasma freundtii TaxID=74700 RepID=A0A2K8NS22_9MOLU|nr:ribonuclease R [Entomoplasma freundtii]ATZ16652.1 ribonuclease R [Entomoplasma freundtii]TDY58181.1 ribonuclease R [Entomoplasma freundtii]